MIFLFELFALILLLVILYSLFFPLPFVKGARFQPTRYEKVREILKVANVKKGEKVLDIGCGTGRIVAAFAKERVEVHGWEINPVLYLWAKAKILLLGLSKNAKIHYGSFWKDDFSKYDVITTFQTEEIMGELNKKLHREAKKGAKIVAYRWKFPGWEYISKSRDIYLYSVKKTNPNL